MRRCIYTALKHVLVSPNKPSTPLHSVRIDDDLWNACVRKAHDEGTTVTEVVRQCLRRFLRD